VAPVQSGILQGVARVADLLACRLRSVASDTSSVPKNSTRYGGAATATSLALAIARAWRGAVSATRARSATQDRHRCSTIWRLSFWRIGSTRPSLCLTLQFIVAYILLQSNIVYYVVQLITYSNLLASSNIAMSQYIVLPGRRFITRNMGDILFLIAVWVFRRCDWNGEKAARNYTEPALGSGGSPSFCSCCF
jgi:hypothetical protein